MSHSATPVKEVWFLLSEFASERAGSFRQVRWGYIFLETGVRLRIFNLLGALRYSDQTCNSAQELASLRTAAVAHYQGPQAGVRQGLLAAAVRRIKHLLLVDLYLPNVLRLLWHVHTQLKQRQAQHLPPVVLLASSPPFSLALLGALLKRWHGPQVVLALDMRDAWALHNALGGIKPLKRSIERWVLRQADESTTVSHGLADEWQAAYGVQPSVTYNVATHYLDVEPAQPIDWAGLAHETNVPLDPQRRQLVYTGSTPQGHYDLKTIVNAWRLLRESEPQLANRLQLVFVGACAPLQAEAVAQGVADGDMIFIKHLPHAQARSVQAGAHALIFLAHFGPNNMGVVSTKLFEYLCLGQPVLPLGLHQGSDVDQLLQRYCGSSLHLHSSAAMMQAWAKIAREGNVCLPRLDDVQRVRELLDDYRAFAKKCINHHA